MIKYEMRLQKNLFLMETGVISLKIVNQKN